jgi:hypothetical protein
MSSTLAHGRRFSVVAVMLLAALALVVHGAARSVAHPVAVSLETVGASLVGHGHGGDAGQSRSDAHLHADLLADVPVHAVQVHAVDRHAGVSSHAGHDATCQEDAGDDGCATAMGGALPGQDLPGLDCCTAVAAVVLPSPGGAQPRLSVLAGVLAPGHAAELDGLSPDGPTKPPRTPCQV